MGLFQKPPTGSFFLFYILIFICLFIYETIVRSSAWSFGHSDPDPSSVNRVISHNPNFRSPNTSQSYNKQEHPLRGFLGALRAQHNWAQTKYMEQNSHLCEEELYFMLFQYATAVAQCCLYARFSICYCDLGTLDLLALFPFKLQHLQLVSL